MAAGNSYTAGNTGGEATHTLTVSEMPSHTHKENVNGNGADLWAGSYGSMSSLPNSGGSISGYAVNSLVWTSASATYVYTGSTGGSAAHNNMPPYLVVYVWKRTA